VDAFSVALTDTPVRVPVKPPASAVTSEKLNAVHVWFVNEKVKSAEAAEAMAETATVEAMKVFI
jgi:hypothetical protein